MTPEEAAALRAPFPANSVGKLPRLSCWECRDAQSKACSKHPKTWCSECNSKISPQHLHLDYVGHADVTDRLLAVDPSWSWEPLAFDAEGLPRPDGSGGLWIKLTVCGVTRLGYGDASGKRGGDAVKEIIGDALRNASMRFGVALDLWRKEPADDAPEAPTPAPARAKKPTPKDAAGLVAEEAAKAGYVGDDLDLYIATTYPNRTLPELTTDELQAEWKYFHEMAKARGAADQVMA